MHIYFCKYFHRICESLGESAKYSTGNCFCNYIISLANWAKLSTLQVQQSVKLNSPHCKIRIVYTSGA
jgi:hypothetical protein